MIDLIIRAVEPMGKKALKLYRAAKPWICTPPGRETIVTVRQRHQSIAVTLFRCISGQHNCDCQEPCEEAQRAFEQSFAHQTDQEEPLPLAAIHYIGRSGPQHDSGPGGLAA